MTFFRLDTVAHFGHPPDGATLIDLDGKSPFRGLALTTAALAEVLWLHVTRYDGGRWANLSEANLSGADLSGADLREANLSGADLSGAVGIVTPDEEAANIAAAVANIAAEPHNWDQGQWHGGGYLADQATAVGSCGTAHCLAGWLQAGLPLGDPRRKLDPESCGWAMAPRAAAAGWFGLTAHPDLQAMVDAAVAKRNASPA